MVQSIRQFDAAVTNIATGIEIVNAELASVNAELSVIKQCPLCNQPIGNANDDNDNASASETSD